MHERKYKIENNRLVKRCDEGYTPIDEEELWGVPVKDQPQLDPERNYFDENQPIINHEGHEGK